MKWPEAIEAGTRWPDRARFACGLVGVGGAGGSDTVRTGREV